MNAARTLQYLQAHPDYVHLHGLTGIEVELKYATADNFMGRNVYGAFHQAFLHRVAADKLRHAVTLLQEKKPGYRFLVYDALRPRSAQRILWAHVKGSEQEAYVAHPDKGSVHNYGLAVDLTCLDEKNAPLDMGSAFDSFHPISQPRLEEQHLASGELTHTQWENRIILREAMTGAGFIQLSHEWWHYDALSREQIRSDFALIE